jgi:hypothetical protein
MENSPWGKLEYHCRSQGKPPSKYSKTVKQMVFCIRANAYHTYISAAVQETWGEKMLAGTVLIDVEAAFPDRTPQD